jgi:hypothetical protein
MPANLTIYIGTVNSSGVRVPLVNAKVYLRPSRTDITYLNGANYLPWDVNQTSDPGYRDCWVATTNGAGFATFQNVPFTDTEMHRPKDQTGAFIGPAIEWQLVNPNGASTSGNPSVVVYAGKLLSTMVLPSPVNVPDDVMSLSVDAWRVTQMAYTANPVGGGWQSGSITFGVGVTQGSITFAPAYLAPPRVLVGNEYDKDGNFSAAAVAQDPSGVEQVTVSSATIQVAAGLTSAVNIPYLVMGV